MSPSLDVLVKFGSITLGILFFMSLLFMNWRNEKKSNLSDLMVVGVGGSSVPTGIALIYCSFDPSQITKLSDVGIYIAFAGLALLYIAIVTFKEKL